MKSNLLLFVQCYPFNDSEAFIENEIYGLSKAFKRIVIVCVNLYKKNVQTRDVPENVKIVKGYYCTGFDKYILFPIIAGFKLLNTCLSDFKPKGYKHKLYKAYIETRENRKVSYLLKKFKLINLQRDDTVIYSYWLDGVADIAVKINEKYYNNSCKIISRAHRSDLYEYASKFGYMPMLEYCVQGVDAVCPCSQDGGYYLAEKFPKFKDKIHTCYLGTKDYGEPCKDKSKDEVVKICSCSFIKPIKRVDMIMEALAQLNSNVKIQWTHFGDGTGMADIYRKRANEIMKSKSAIKINFYGEVCNNDLMQIYKNSSFDLFINVSSSEGLPVSIMEACSFNMAILATDVGGTRELVNQKNGFLIRSDTTISELANIIKGFIDLPVGEKNLLKMESRKNWQKHFKAETNYQDFIEKYLSME